MQGNPKLSFSANPDAATLYGDSVPDQYRQELEVAKATLLKKAVAAGGKLTINRYKNDLPEIFDSEGAFKRTTEEQLLYLDALHELENAGAFVFVNETIYRLSYYTYVTVNRSGAK